MWRAFFLAVGAYCCLLGVEALALDQAVLKPQQGAAARTITPADWAPWSLMGAGAVVVLYSFSIPRRVGS